jgi:dihydrofolate reductase
MVTLYNVTSADGFIARKDDSEDFIPDELWDDFLKYCKENEAVVIGGKTYKSIQSYDDELKNSFESLPIERIIVTKDSNFEAKPGYTVLHSPQEAVSRHTSTLVCSGPNLNSLLLREKLVDKVIVIVLPEAIGEGIRQFDFDTSEILVLESEETREGEQKIRTYNVSR